jgi:glycosyltransferase involved in cell wall biosynthesis
MKISVTIPSFKSRYLDEAIKSVTNQTWQDWELIIVDDYSPENLKSIVDQYINDPRIHYYRNDKNCGIIDVVDNWNICLSHCNGDYVICIGDDDRLLPCCLEEYQKLVKKFPGLNIYHARTQIIDEEGRIIGYQEERPLYETCEEMLFRQWKEDRKQFIGDFMISRKWLNKNGGYIKFPLAYSSDWATANLAAKEKGIANGQTVMFEYRDNQYTISRSQNLKIAVKACSSSQRWYSKTFYGMLPPFFHTYFRKKMTDMIYLDVKQNQFASTYYWFTHRKYIGLSIIKLLNVCMRGILSSFRN